MPARRSHAPKRCEERLLYRQPIVYYRVCRVRPISTGSPPYVATAVNTAVNTTTRELICRSEDLATGKKAPITPPSAVKKWLSTAAAVAPAADDDDHAQHIPRTTQDCQAQTNPNSTIDSPPTMPVQICIPKGL